MKGCRYEPAKLDYRKEAAGPGGRTDMSSCASSPEQGSEASLYLLLGGGPEPLKLASTAV